jgi:DNA-binding CsgD family transcriptional regulator
VTAPLPGPLRLTPSFPFAGRGRELSALRALLPRAVGEGRRVALVAGEAGSGKSRLVRELAHELSREDAVVLYGACDAVVRTPYGPFVTALDHLVRTTDPETVRHDLGSAGGELVRLLPELPLAVGELPRAVSADADTERHRLHSAVTDLLTTTSARMPVLLVLEDVHWADAPTLLLVRHLVRAGASARMLLVATFRDAEAEMSQDLSESLVDVHRTEGVIRLRLGGLSGEEVAEFVRLASGVDAGAEVTAAIGSLTEGNAFLVTELWRELVESDAVEVGATSVRLARPMGELGTPETVREVVSLRLSRLAPPTNLVLEIGAVAGAEFELDTLRRAAGLDEGALLDAVDDSVRNGLVAETPSLRLAYRFTHELVRRAVMDRLSAARRAEIHLWVATALEERTTGDESGARLSALAHHHAAAAPLGDRTRAIETNLLAARAAAEALAFDEATERLQTALELGIDDARLRADATLELGHASHKAGRAGDALEAFTRTADLARALGDPELLARAAVGFEEACWRPGIYDAGSVELLEEAELALAREDSDLRARVLGGLARALDFRGESERAASVRDEAIAMSRRLGDRTGLAWTLAASYWSRGVSTNEQINGMLVEALEIGDELGDVEIRTEALSWLVPSHVVLCDHDAARRTLASLLEAARRNSQPFHLHVAEHYASALALCDGDLAAAESAAMRSRDWSRLLTGRDASGVHGIQMFAIRREQGRLAELAPVVRLLAADGGRDAWRPGLVALLAELGMHDEARRELRRLRADGLDALRRSLWLVSLTFLVDAATAVGDEEMAALVYPELEPYAGGNVMIGHLVSCNGAFDRYLGMTAAVLGEWDRAEAHFESALVLNERLGARTWTAHTAYEYGRMLLGRGVVDDRDRAVMELGTALTLAGEIGMTSLEARVAALGATVEPPPRLPDGLSAREAEILTHVARGLSNRQIGQALHISEHTTANHVRSILRKTGCANRTEAAAYAHRRGLVGG